MTGTRAYVRGLRVALGWGTLLLVAAALVVLLGQTLKSAARGERPWSGTVSVAGVGEVGQCREHGPMSRYGFGRYWSCDVVVRLDDGRHRATTLDRSIVTPADRGRPVPLVESCDRAGPDRGDCVYTRPGGAGLSLLARLFEPIAWILGGATAGFGLVLVWFGVRGPRRGVEPAAPAAPTATPATGPDRSRRIRVVQRLNLVVLVVAVLGALAYVVARW